MVKETEHFAKLAVDYFFAHGVYILLSIFLSFFLIQAPASVSLDDFRRQLDSTAAVLGGCLLLCLLIIYLLVRPRPVYLMEIACYKPKKSTQVSISVSDFTGVFSPENLEFQRRILERSGLGHETYLPETVVRAPSYNHPVEARKEASAVMFEPVEALLKKTGLRPEDVDILIVNCGLFNPAPSLSAMVANRFKLRHDVITFNLGGMGCSASPIAIALARDLLQLNRNSYAIVISIENTAMGGRYDGKDRSMLVSNCLFRVGGAAVLLTNKRSERRRSKYQLMHVVRTHTGAEDQSFMAAAQAVDADGKLGVSLSKNLMAVAADALRINLTTLGPLILPTSEKLLYVAKWLAGRVMSNKGGVTNAYVPDFTRAVEHVCIHTGGRAVVEEMGRCLRLTEWHLEPSRMTLYRFGNTSSSSVWYVLAYTEAKGRVRKGDRVWQIALGGGFKCNSAVWRALRTVEAAAEDPSLNPWVDEIRKFPVQVVATPNADTMGIRLVKFDY
ncbi:3-ketoacyl-CoA synthase 11-like [Zingiber officinale]|uniref:3-ketoacyl-CoA synthase n=1 Tax=Zingiber officinale TaxID=94328 RepID=A0A8J5F845_ZINOF|nr:3-ketoacyl-CoA synthase 11-like [Zingiber officinale]KAG6482005.1 hypothetical protein ZIOFF_058632 [Zingiber officinale]